MLEVLNFIFRDFWTFCGVVILLYAIGESISYIIHGKPNTQEENEEEK